MNTKHLKAKILDLAIRGKLVPQNPNDESAAVLLDHHRNAPVSSVVEPVETTISEDKIPFEIPEGWVWCRLSEVSNSIIAGGDKPSVCTKEKTETTKIPIYANAIEKNGLYGYTDKAQIYVS